MASANLYPPILDSAMPVFRNNESCKIVFSLSRYNSINDIKEVHISVAYQKSDLNAVNRVNAEENNSYRYRETGIIILNEGNIKSEGDNLYSVTIIQDDINGAWKAGELYKVQLRFSSMSYADADDLKTDLVTWLNNNGNYFSEWSTICIIKPIDEISISIPVFNYVTPLKEEDSNSIKTRILYSSTLDFQGSYYCKTRSELLYSYKVTLYDSNDNIVETSNTLFTNEYDNTNYFQYLFATDLDNADYKLIFTYSTEHGYTDTLTFNFNVQGEINEPTDFFVLTVDNDIDNIFEGKTSLEEEEEEGRIGIKIYDSENRTFSGNLCIRRTDSKSNFTKWEDIQILTYKNEVIRDKEIFFDYTIESGVLYKYGVQILTQNSDGSISRSGLSAQSIPIVRNFNYSYLLGENGVQLKLKYDNDMNSYKINVSESRTDTIGGMYPFITRNGNPNYKTFPVNGLISFAMDDMNTFMKKKEVYNDETSDGAIVSFYNKYNETNNITQYDYFYERFFREKVLKFLYDGKPKLFKSTTEGNIIIRLMDINTAPKQELSRMIYSFSSTGYEVAEPTLSNYLKYNFTSINEPDWDFRVYKEEIGQIIDDFNINENICKRIWDTYDSNNKNYAGVIRKVNKIKHLKIEINSKPFKITNNSKGGGKTKEEYVIGNKINCKGNIIIIYGNKGIYEFDPLMSFSSSDDVVAFLGPDDPSSKETKINATIDFVYEISEEPYIGRKIASKSLTYGLGQYYENTFAGSSIYDILFYKYFTDWEDKYSKIKYLKNISIEAPPGAVFFIKDSIDSVGEEHEIGYTGVLRVEGLTNIKELKFLGFKDANGNIVDEITRTVINKEGVAKEIKYNVNADILIDYQYVLEKGEYEKNVK